jgi:hypothetical protein
MIRSILMAVVIFAMPGVNAVGAEQAVDFKNFSSFKNLIPGIDFYASNRQAISAYEKPAADTIAKLKILLGEDLPKGAIFVCSTLAQKDSVYEPMVLKRGYGWTLTSITADARRQEMMERMKSQMGGEIPAEILERMKSRMTDMSAEAEKQMATTTAQQIAYAVIQSKLGKDIQFRSSRLDDMTKSPLPDWLDIGIASYASGVNSNLSFLQQHMDQTFPIDDVITMSRPFVASSFTDRLGGGGDRGGMSRSGSGGSGGFGGGQNFPSGGMGGMGQGIPQGGFTGMSQGSSSRGSSNGRTQGVPGGSGSSRGGGQRNIPKDEQDRMLFDGQSSTFFSFLLEKVGIEKIKELIQAVQQGTEGRDFIARPDVLGPDFAKTEAEWANWVKALKAPQNGGSGFPRFN